MSNVLTFQFSKYFVCRSARAFARLREAAANARYGVQLTGYFLVSLDVENDGLGFAFYSEHHRTSGFLHVLHQARETSPDRNPLGRGL